MNEAAAKTALTNIQVIIIHGKYRDRRTKDFTLVFTDGAGSSYEENIIKNGYFQKTITEAFKEWQRLQIWG